MITPISTRGPSVIPSFRPSVPYVRIGYANRQPVLEKGLALVSEFLRPAD